MLRRMAYALVTGERKTENQIERYMESVGLNMEDVLDRTKWKREILNYSDDLR